MHPKLKLVKTIKKNFVTWKKININLNKIRKSFIFQLVAKATFFFLQFILTWYIKEN